MTPEEEFDRQIQNLIGKGYPGITGIPQARFLAIVDPLRPMVKRLSVGEIDLEKGKLPFVLVVKRDVASVPEAMSRVEKDGKKGIIKLFPLKAQDFSVTGASAIPAGSAYLAIDIDRGKKTLNVPPGEAMNVIKSNRRVPLTIEEGVAIVTQYPGFLMKNNCFSLLASRHLGDKRVPAIWINAKGHPNLGWCWEGNPHTWLGSASCAARIGI